ncbi:MAG: chorismate-binding protein, partial [Pseudomonadota bacterium]|nr:chorismate-binding protein [Pseudomonadota bacterium]
MSPEEFSRLAAEGYNRVPVAREILADLDTPLSSYLKLAQGKYSYLLESVQGGEKWGRYSMIGLPARTVLKAFANRVLIETDGQVVEEFECDDPLDFVMDFKNRFRVAESEDLPRFNGGLVGYFGYDCVRYVEPKLKAGQPEDTIGTPDILLMVSDEVLVFDNLSGRLTVIVHVDPQTQGSYQAGMARIDTLEAALRELTPAPAPMKLSGDSAREGEFKSSFGEDSFKRAVGNIKEYVLSGDTMQVVISQRLSIPFDAEPLNLYRALRCLNPSPNMFYLDLGDHHVVGASPEILARLEDGEVTVRPIAGTRRRGHTEAEDLALEQDLVNDPKEIAEHLMLIDLGRNDVGRVAKVGEVKLTEKMVVERYSHVMHITSNVTGALRDDLDAM